MSKYEKLQSRQNYPRVWQMPLTQTISRPGFCCFAMFCSYCASYTLRKQALYNDMSRSAVAQAQQQRTLLNLKEQQLGPVK
jgi:hypothetical protein